MQKKTSEAEPFKQSEGRILLCRAATIKYFRFAWTFVSVSKHVHSSCIACEYILRTFSFVSWLKFDTVWKISHATRRRIRKAEQTNENHTTIHALTQCVCVCVEWMSVENTKIGSMKRFNLIQWSNQHLSAASRKDYLWSAQTHNV